MHATVSDRAHAALAVASRRRLLEVLRHQREPMDVVELAGTVALHVTTVRTHLDILERAGLVRRVGTQRGRTGRPKQLYAAVSDGAEGHRQLAEMLAGALAADPDRGTAGAEQAGRAWATAQLPDQAVPSWDAATRRVADVFTDLGFAARVVDDERSRHLHLEACPFRDVARAHPDIVCTVHLGLWREALNRLGVAHPERATLRPFVRPELCIADIPRASASD
ncbi:hypothetical protein BKD30_13040 [Tersicoccus phoenicis]|uniref:HTH arsR-type domain-containing protein n=1 Tax=Tersicoccus phoenicis TaxID=554083 RepID=A0A1R1L6Y1_9MICC|nr:helix-turn-helix domain-containing protein [Tersicoccus phoenicis]OMH23273.1 hypothetical protein BKD30_13040 [Tersicoccus phoenicis]